VRFVAADRHGDVFRHARPDHISYSAAAQIVEDSARKASQLRRPFS
jgi:hypothetical protein